MASARTESIEVSPAVPAITEERVILYLTKEEAIVLKKITQRVGGSPDNTARKYVDNVGRALGDVLGHRLIEDDHPIFQGTPLRGDLRFGY